MIFIVMQITEPLLETVGPYTEGTEAESGTVWLSFAVDYLPIVILGIAFFGFIAYSVFIRRGVFG